MSSPMSFFFPTSKMKILPLEHIPYFCHTRLELGFWIQAVLWWEPECVIKSDFTNPPTHHPPGSWICSFIVVRCPHPNCSRSLCSVPILVWTSDQITSMGMCGVPPYFEHLTRCPNLKCAVVSPPPPNSQTSYQFGCQSSLTCISECGTPS